MPCASGVLGDQRAADVQAVVVAVGVVAQRQAVQRIAQALTVEAAQADGLRLLVGAERVVGLHVHARHPVEHLLQAAARGQHGDVLGGHALHLAGFALADHRDRFEVLRGVRLGRRVGDRHVVGHGAVGQSGKRDGGGHRQQVLLHEM